MLSKPDQGASTDLLVIGAQQQRGNAQQRILSDEWSRELRSAKSKKHKEPGRMDSPSICCTGPHSGSPGLRAQAETRYGGAQGLSESNRYLGQLQRPREALVVAGSDSNSGKAAAQRPEV